ncbi:MAG: hypothetical protein FJ214_09570 [Ignavibacteria bacterium]|nr:hypothetical protein [Ignavibacteria bacterium]
MKAPYKFFFLIFIASAIFAQTVPNHSFESWSDGKPVKWGTPNSDDFKPVTKTNDKHSGQYALKGQVIKIEFQGMPKVLTPAAIQSGEDGKGFPITSVPTIVTGWFKFLPNGGDKLVFGAVLMNGDTELGEDALIINDRMTTYNMLQLNLKNKWKKEYARANRIIITVSIIGPTTGQDWHEGTYFIVDDISIAQ